MTLSGLRVLLAEDNPTNQLVAVQMLECLGASVSLARDGAEALEIAAGEEFDVMLVDIEMPRVSGIDVIRTLRGSTGRNARLPMIALTAYVMREHRAAISAAGADGIIAKPILSIEQLGADVRRYMRDREGQSEEATASKPDAAGASRPVIDESVYHSLVQAIGPDAMSELLGKVDTDVESARTRLAEALEFRNAEEVRSASHILISVAGAIGAVQVQEGAKQVNTTAHQGDLVKVEELAPALFEDIRSMVEVVRGRLAKEAADQVGKR